MWTMWQEWNDEQQRRMHAEQECARLTRWLNNVLKERDELKKERDELKREKERRDDLGGVLGGVI
jgi:hypothetical protein